MLSKLWRLGRFSKPGAPPDLTASKPAAPRTPPSVVPADLDAIRAAIRPQGRPLVVNHWASWCPDCVSELPQVARLVASLAGKADFIGVCWECFENPDAPEAVAREVAEFAGEAGLHFPSVLFNGQPEELFSGLDLTWHHIPQIFVLSATGSVLRHHQGELGVRDADELIALVERESAAGPESAAPAG